MHILDPSFENLTTKHCHNIQWAEQIYVATSDKTLAKCLLKVNNSHTANEEFFAFFLCLALKLQLKFGLSEKHTKIYLVNVQTMRKIFKILCASQKVRTLKAFLAISIVLMDITHLLALLETRSYVGITLDFLFFSVCYEDACFGIDKTPEFAEIGRVI